MPNWVKNIITAKAETINKIKEKYFENDVLSFQKVIPMPDELNIESSGRGEQGLMYLFLENDHGINKETINKVYRSLNCFHTDIYREERFRDVVENYDKNKNKFEYNKCVELAKQYISNYQKYGHAEWYEWCVANWGTKWDACRVCYDETRIVFETAWSSPANILVEMSKGLENEEFELQFADEDFGSDNNGVVRFRNGNVIEQDLDKGEDFVTDVWYNSINYEEKTPDIVDDMFE